ncbi:hypothetical protein [Rubrivirga sp. IMCC45206]|uniref:hypothetical protein n=1 Tax=Rubrivirga sp. IMCC45206 TaxID=3391614 RepID=UPI00398FD37F
MNTSRAFIAGVVGGAVMSVLLFVGRLLGMDVSIESMMGTMFLEPGTLAFVVGLVMHLMLSGLIALAYAWGFETITKRASAGLGAAFSVVHVLVAGVVMGAMIPAVHRLIPEQMAGPGYFLSNHDAMGVAAFVMLHLVFGAIVGAMYAGHVRARA